MKAQDRDLLLRLLQGRFEQNPRRHPGRACESVLARLPEARPGAAARASTARHCSPARRIDPQAARPRPPPAWASSC